MHFFISTQPLLRSIHLFLEMKTPIYLRLEEKEIHPNSQVNVKTIVTPILLLN